MARKADFDLDAALAALAREVRDASPRPGPDLLERVLADAASVAAGRPGEARRPATRATRRRAPLIAAVFGWTSGALASMALGLAFGVGLGLEIDPEALPVLEEPPAEEVPVSLAAIAPDLGPVGGL